MSWRLCGSGPEDASRSVWDRAIRRHVLTTSAVYHRVGGRAIVSHQSAVLLHGIQVSDLDLSRVHLTRVSGHGRTGREVCLHAARPPVLDPAEVSRIQLTSAPRAVVETIRGTAYAVAVSVVDEALRRRLATSDQLTAAVKLFSGRSGVRTAARAVAFGDGLAESVGESRLRVLLADLGLPQPALQVEIRDSAGRLVARVDFLLERWGVVIEFDGALKYAGSGADALIAEKDGRTGSATSGMKSSG